MAAVMPPPFFPPSSPFLSRHTSPRLRPSPYARPNPNPPRPTFPEPTAPPWLWVAQVHDHLAGGADIMDDFISPPVASPFLSSPQVLPAQPEPDLNAEQLAEDQLADEILAALAGNPSFGTNPAPVSYTYPLPFTLSPPTASTMPSYTSMSAQPKYRCDNAEACAACTPTNSPEVLAARSRSSTGAIAMSASTTLVPEIAISPLPAATMGVSPLPAAVSPFPAPQLTLSPPRSPSLAPTSSPFPALPVEAAPAPSNWDTWFLAQLSGMDGPRPSEQAIAAPLPSSADSFGPPGGWFPSSFVAPRDYGAAEVAPELSEAFDLAAMEALDDDVLAQWVDVQLHADGCRCAECLRAGSWRGG